MVKINTAPSLIPLLNQFDQLYKGIGNIHTSLHIKQLYLPFIEHLEAEVEQKLQLERSRNHSNTSADAGNDTNPLTDSLTNKSTDSDVVVGQNTSVASQDASSVVQSPIISVQSVSTIPSISAGTSTSQRPVQPSGHLRKRSAEADDTDLVKRCRVSWNWSEDKNEKA